MKKGLTEMVFILDRSGSMAGLESDTIGGFNSLIEKQKKEEGEALVSTVLFSNSSEVLHDRVPLMEIKPLTDADYTVSGCTALMDAMGDAISHVTNIHKYARDEDVPEHTIFVIMTDGMENASREYSSDQIKKLVNQRKKQGWEFIFLGANIDAVETAKHYGIAPERSATFVNDSCGQAVSYKAMSRAVSSLRTAGCVAEDWCAEVNAYTDKKNGQVKRGIFGKKQN